MTNKLVDIVVNGSWVTGYKKAFVFNSKVSYKNRIVFPTKIEFLRIITFEFIYSTIYRPFKLNNIEGSMYKLN